MILTALVGLCFTSLIGIIGLLPEASSFDLANSIPSYLSGLYSMLSVSARFVPWDIIALCIGNIIFWLQVHFGISVIRFILDFIPLF